MASPNTIWMETIQISGGILFKRAGAVTGKACFLTNGIAQMKGPTTHQCSELNATPIVQVWALMLTPVASVLTSIASMWQFLKKGPEHNLTTQIDIMGDRLPSNNLASNDIPFQSLLSNIHRNTFQLPVPSLLISQLKWSAAWVSY